MTIAPVLCGWTMDRGPLLLNDFDISLRIEQEDSLNFKTTITVVSDVLVTSVSYYALVIDNTYMDRMGYVDVGFTFQQVSGSNTTFFFPVTLTNQMLVGVNSFRYFAADVPDFTFDLTSFSLSTTSLFQFLNVTVLQVRSWDCNGSTPYYDPINDLCTDNCIASYVDYYFTNGKCMPCYSYCDQCFGPSSSQCTSCWAYTLRTASLVSFQCECVSDGVFESGVATCSLCSHTCQTCVTSAANCLSCSAANFRTMTLANTCPCDSGYADIGLPACVPCSSLFAGCTACTATSCSACSAVAHFLLSAGSCSCMNGYYLSAGSCLPCVYSCKTCSGSASTCLSCPGLSNRALAAGACPCISGYADAGVATCQPCSTTLVGCAVCSSTAVCNSC